MALFFSVLKVACDQGTTISGKSWTNELLELTWRTIVIFCRIFARSVGGRCLLCNFHVLISPRSTYISEFNGLPVIFVFTTCRC
jgi:hypothetical protein